MALMRFDPFRDIDRWADQAMAGARNLRPMPMEALRRGDQFIVAIDVPGVSPDDVDITVERNVVDITARRRPLLQEGDQVIIDERPYGEFRRQLFLGDNLDINKMNAQYDRGVLMLTIPVSETAKPRKVEIATPNESAQAIQTRSESTQQGQSESGQQGQTEPAQQGQSQPAQQGVGA
jgi:HSP20 family protein